LSSDTGRLLPAALLLAMVAGGAMSAKAEDLPGVTATEVKIGNTNAYSGPASAYGVIAKTEAAFFQMVNDKGGVAGHKINSSPTTMPIARPRRSSRSAA